MTTNTPTDYTTTTTVTLDSILGQYVTTTHPIYSNHLTGAAVGIDQNYYVGTVSSTNYQQQLNELRAEINKLKEEKDLMTASIIEALRQDEVVGKYINEQIEILRKQAEEKMRQELMEKVDSV